MSRNIIFVMMTALGGCAYIGPEPITVDQGTTNGATSICELVAHGLVEGQTARVEATYKTDKSHYAYLLGTGCGKGGILNINDMNPTPEKSIREFYDAGDQRCVKEGTPYICVIAVKIDADIEIIRDQDGKFATKLLKVHKFSFTGSSL